jgi:hypothetical protein
MDNKRRRKEKEKRKVTKSLQEQQEYTIHLSFAQMEGLCLLKCCLSSGIDLDDYDVKAEALKRFHFKVVTK